jgi:hypothetical protein
MKLRILSIKRRKQLTFFYFHVALAASPGF